MSGLSAKFCHCRMLRAMKRKRWEASFSETLPGPRVGGYSRTWSSGNFFSVIPPHFPAPPVHCQQVNIYIRVSLL